MALDNKNTIGPISEQDIRDATIFVETRFTYLNLDKNSIIYKAQRQYWEGWQKTQHGYIEDGDPTTIRNLARQFREYQELAEQGTLQERELGHSAVEGSLAA